MLFAMITFGNLSREMLYSVTASLYAWRANATRFSVEVSSSLSCSMFWLAFRSGYDSMRAKSRPTAPVSAASAPIRPFMALASPGFAAARPSAVTAWLRAWITASSVSRSCFM